MAIAPTEKPKRKKFTEEKIKLTAKQQRMYKDFKDKSKAVVEVLGYPATGKTYLASKYACEQMRKGDINKIIIIRPALDLKIGFLKGDLEDKMSLFTAQYSNYFQEFTQSTLEEMVENNEVEILPACKGGIQGRRFSNCVMIVDEAQNLPKEETFTLLTRMGKNCKVILIGDISKGQQDKKIKNDSMLDYVHSKLKNKPYLSIHEFYNTDDIVASPILKDIIIEISDDFL